MAERKYETVTTTISRWSGRKQKDVELNFTATRLGRKVSSWKLRVWGDYMPSREVLATELFETMNVITREWVRICDDDGWVEKPPVVTDSDGMEHDPSTLTTDVAMNVEANLPSRMTERVT